MTIVNGAIKSDDKCRQIQSDEIVWRDKSFDSAKRQHRTHHTDAAPRCGDAQYTIDNLVDHRVRREEATTPADLGAQGNGVRFSSAE